MKTGMRAALIMGLVAVAASLAIPAAADMLGKSAGRLASAEIPESEGAYTLRSYGNSVAVFSYGEDAPIMQTDICVSAMRASDREMIQKGITVGSYDELLGLLEDFGC